MLHHMALFSPKAYNLAREEQTNTIKQAVSSQNCLPITMLSGNDLKRSIVIKCIQYLANIEYNKLVSVAMFHAPESLLLLINNSNETDLFGTL